MKSCAWHPPENPRQKTPPRSIPGSAARGLRAAAAQRRAGSSGGLRASPADGCHLLLAPRATAGAQKHGKKQNPSRQAWGGTRSAPAKAAKSPLGYLKGCEMPPTSVPIVPHEGLVGDPPCFCCSKLPRWHHFSAPRWQKHRSRGISLGSPSRGCTEAPGVAVLKGTGPMGLQLSCPPPSNSRICPHSSPALGRRPREPAPRGSQFKQETGKTQALPGARRVPSEPPASERRGKEAKFPAPWPDPPRGSGRQNPAAKKKSHSSFSLCLFSALC